MASPQAQPYPYYYAEPHENTYHNEHQPDAGDDRHMNIEEVDTVVNDALIDHLTNSGFWETFFFRFGCSSSQCYFSFPKSDLSVRAIFLTVTAPIAALLLLCA